MGRQPISGYCQTCRKRRVKCDKRRPTCERCQRSGHTCQGYEIPLRFQYNVPGEQQLVRLPVGDGTVSNSNQHYSLRPPQELSLEGFQDNIVLSHFFATYRWANFWRPLIQLQSGENVHYDASLGVALGHMAREFHDERLKTKSLELFLKAVAVLKSTIAGSSKQEIAQLVPTIKVLGVYNYAVESSLKFPHHRGIQQITTWCGPELWQGKQNLPIFRNSRAMLICLSLSHKRRSVMEDQVWKDIPFQSELKTSQDKLLDILADLASVAQQTQATELPDLEKSLCAEKIDNLRGRLRQWRQEWDTSYPDSATEIPSKIKTDAVKIPRFKQLLATGIRLGSVEQAVEIISYDAAMIYLDHAQCLLKGQSLDDQIRESLQDPRTRSLADQHRSTKPLLSPGGAVSTWEYALEGLRIFTCLPDQLVAQTDAGVYVPLGFVGILYCFLKRIGMEGYLAAAISRSPWDSEHELGVYDLDVPVKEAWVLRKSNA